MDPVAVSELIYMVQQVRLAVREQRGADADTQLHEIERLLGSMLPPITGHLVARFDDGRVN